MILAQAQQHWIIDDAAFLRRDQRVAAAADPARGQIARGQ